MVAWGGNHVGQTDVCATHVVAIAAGSQHSLLLRWDRTVAACGRYASGSPDGLPITIPADLTNVIAISTGSSHSLALKADGTVVAWGSNVAGQTNVPPDLTNVVAISAGSDHSLALKADGTVAGWGISGTNVPAGLTNAVAISAGPSSSLVLKADGTVVGWGYFGLGNGKVNLAALSNIVAISAGDNSSYEAWLALQANGVLIRQGAYGGMAPHLSNVVIMAASQGFDHHISLALLTNGSVVGWGYNFYGNPPYSEPMVPAGLTNVIGLAGGSSHNLALIGAAPWPRQTQLINPVWDSDGFRVSTATQNGRVYRLEYKNMLTDSNWTGLPLVAGNGSLRTLTDSTATETQRFYRVRRW